VFILKGVAGDFIGHDIARYCGSFPSVCVRFGEEIAEAVESFLPERTAIFDPLLGDGKAFGFDAAGADAAYFFGVDEAAFFEDLQVLDDGGEGDLERLGQTRDGDGAFAEFFDDGAARGIAESVEDAVDRGLLRVHGAFLFRESLSLAYMELREPQRRAAAELPHSKELSEALIRLPDFQEARASRLRAAAGHRRLRSRRLAR
jgi:hypothetical protein